MKCSICKSEIEECKNCGRGFELGEELLCDDLEGVHMCRECFQIDIAKVIE